MAGEAPERGETESESIGKAASHETPVGVKTRTGEGSAMHVTPVGVKLQAGGSPVKYPSAPRKSAVPSTSSINNRRQTVSAPHVDIDHSDEDASNKSDMDADEDRSRDRPKKKVQDGTVGVAGLGNREVGRNGTEAAGAAGDNSSKAVPKLTKKSVENQKGLGRLEGKDVMETRLRLSKTRRAGLVMPVAKVLNGLKKGRYAPRVKVDAAVYMAASLEYVVAEVLELAGNCSKYMKRKRITPRHIQMTFLHDAELGELTKGVIVPEGGVKPNILKELLPPHQQMKTNDDADNSEATQRAASTDVSTC